MVLLYVGSRKNSRIAFSYLTWLLLLGLFAFARPASAAQPATVTLVDLVQPYDGTAKIVSAVTDPEGLAVDLFYDGSADAPTNTGNYTVVAVVSEPGYVGRGKDTLSISPAVTNVIFPPEGIYGVGRSLEFTAAFSGNVTVVTNDGTPTIQLSIGESDREAIYVFKNNNSSLTFRYVIQPGDNGTISVGPEIFLNGAVIQDDGGHDVELSFTRKGARQAVADTSAPAITIGDPSVSLTSGDPVTFVVSYDDPNFLSSSLSAGDIVLNHTGSAIGTVSVSGDESTRTVTISGMSGYGTLSISIAAGTAVDVAGNLSAAAEASPTFIVDPTGTTLTLSALNSSTLRLELIGAPLGAYTIEGTENLTDPNWQELGTVQGDNYGNASFDVAKNQASQFFRARRPVDSGSGPGR